MNKKHAILILPLVMLVTGCVTIGGGGGGEPPAVYTLKPSQGTAAVSQNAPAVAVTRPELPVGFATERIVLFLENGNKLDYYAGAKWSGRFDNVLQEFIAEVARGDLPGAVSDTSDLASSARYRLSVKFSDIQPVYEGDAESLPRIDVRMTVALIRQSDGSVVKQATAEKSAQASENRMSAVVQTLQAVLQSALSAALQEIGPALPS